jgi:hypothetical protein
MPCRCNGGDEPDISEVIIEENKPSNIAGRASSIPRQLPAPQCWSCHSIAFRTPYKFRLTEPEAKSATFEALVDGN